MMVLIVVVAGICFLGGVLEGAAEEIGAGRMGVDILRARLITPAAREFLQKSPIISTKVTWPSFRLNSIAICPAIERVAFR